MSIRAALLCFLSSIISATAWAGDAWRDYWVSVNVEPAPPRNFLDVEFKGRIDNLTRGALSDATVRQWVLADLRRSMGDLYASQNLRDDIANAGIFGPPGLNGTTDLIEELRAAGVDRIDAPMMAEYLAAAVVPVSRETQQKNPDVGFTDYVIVLLYRPRAAGGVTIYTNGQREPIASSANREPRWQIDTGHFVAHPTLGPLWYQERGWTCRPDSSAVGQICGLVKP
jgi:hypothetical protein